MGSMWLVLRSTLVLIVMLNGKQVQPTGIKSPRIIGGNPVRIQKFPYQVSIEHQQKHRCGGAIITNSIILTAAHCLKSIPVEKLQIRAGATLRQSGGIVRSIRRYEIHPKYDYALFDYDIGLMFLNENLTLSSSVGVVRLSASGENVPAGTMTQITGWGRISEQGPQTESLYMVQVPVITNEYCAELYRASRKMLITSRMICAGQGGKDSCTYDSGGPMVHNGTVVGIISWGIGCAQRQYPGVYTRVSALRDWIEECAGV